MSKIAFSPDPSGTGIFTVAAPNSNSNRTLTLPDAAGTVALQGGAGVGKVLQVVQGTRQASFSTTSTTFVSTGLTATITPTSATSKVLAVVHSNADSGASGRIIYCTLYRDSTNLGHTNEGFGGTQNSAGNVRADINISYLDSPSTTSATTYTLYCRSSTGTVECPAWGSMVQTIILMEIAA